MKLKTIFIYSVYILIINIITACSSIQHVVYDKDSQYLNLFNKHKYNDEKKFEEYIQLKIKKLQKNNIVYFPLDQYDVLNQFFHILDEHVIFLCNYPLHQVKIEGHTDERGTPEYNIALGERRANSVKLYLQSKGILSKQIKIVSYGKEKPVALEHNESAYSKNRRAVLIY